MADDVPAVAPGPVLLKLVGSLALRGPAAVPVPTGRAARLLKILAAHHDQTVALGVIIEALWPDDPPAAAGRNVAALVSRLRNAIGREAIHGDSGGYRLVTSPVLDVDLAEADRLIASAERDLSRQAYGLAALAANRAESILSGSTVLIDEPDSGWLVSIRSRTTRRLRQARRLRWSAALAAADFSSAVASAEAALEDDPMDEEACRALMSAYQQSSLPGAALSVYEKLRTALAEELGIDPGEASQALYLSILHSDQPRATVERPFGHRERPSGAPTGREAQFAELLNPWAAAIAGHGGLCTIVGAAGMGKRTLVAALAARVADAGAMVVSTTCFEAERSLFLQPLVEAARTVLLQQSPTGMRELLGSWAGPLADLIPEISQILGPIQYEHYLPEAQHRRTLEAFGSFFTVLERQRPLLLIVEAIEHASDVTLEAIHFLANRFAAQRILIVATLDATDSEAAESAFADTARHIELEPLDIDAIRELVAANTSRLDPDRLLDLTGGSPLYLSELIRHEQELDASTETPVPLPATLRAAITERLALVGDQVVELLQLGCVLGETFTLDDVSTLGELRVEDCARRAARALRAGLLVTHRTSFGFASRILREVLYQAMPAPTRLNRHQRAADLLSDRPEAAAAQWAAAENWAPAVQAWSSAADTAHRALDNIEAERLLSAAVDAAERLGQPSVIAESVMRRGQIRSELGRYEQAHDDHQRALDIARELLDDSLEARALEELGWTALYARDALAAADLAARSTKLAEQAAAVPGAPRSAWLLLGRVRHWDGDFAGASQAYDMVLTDRPDDEITAQALTFRGSLLQHMDRFDEAREALARAAVLCRSNGLIRPLLQALFFTALAQGDSGDFGSALRSVYRARRLIDQNGVTYYSAGVDTTTSWLLREIGEMAQAREIAERAEDQAVSNGGALELEQGLHATLAVAECLYAAGDIESAASRVTESVHFLNQQLPYHARAEMRLLDMQARFDPAFGEPLLALAKRSSSPKYQALGLAHLGRVEEAAHAASQMGSDHLIAQLGSPKDSWQAILRLARLLTPERRETFMAHGRLPQLWRQRTGRLSG